MKYCSLVCVAGMWAAALVASGCDREARNAESLDTETMEELREEQQEETALEVDPPAYPVKRRQTARAVDPRVDAGTPTPTDAGAE